MVKIITHTEGSHQCNGCMRATFNKDGEEPLQFIHEVSIGYRNQFITTMMCNQCLLDLVKQSCTSILNTKE